MSAIVRRHGGMFAVRSIFGGKADVASCWPKTVFLNRPRRSTIVAPLNAERRGFGKRQSTAPAARPVSPSSPVLGIGGDVKLDTLRAVLSIP